MIPKNKLKKIFNELFLMNYINELNEKTQELMDANPNIWISKLINDPDHWAEYGVFTPKHLDAYLDKESDRELERYI